MELSLLCGVNIALIIADEESSTFISYKSSHLPDAFEPGAHHYSKLIDYTNDNVQSFS